MYRLKKRIISLVIVTAIMICSVSAIAISLQDTDAEPYSVEVMDNLPDRIGRL